MLKVTYKDSSDNEVTEECWEITPSSHGELVADRGTCVMDICIPVDKLVKIDTDRDDERKAVSFEVLCANLTLAISVLKSKGMTDEEICAAFGFEDNTEFFEGMFEAIANKDCKALYEYTKNA